MSADKREHGRHPVSLDVFATFDNRQVIFCTITDFCLGGLFLHYTTKNIKHKIELEQSLLVELDTPEGGLLLEGEVARITDSGFGVRFTLRNLAAIVFLQEIAQKQQTENQNQEAETKLELALSCSTLIGGFWYAFIDRFVRMAIDELFESSNKSTPSVRQDLFDAHVALQKHSWDLCQYFHQHVQLQLHSVTEEQEIPAYKSPGTSSDQLSIVSADEFNNWVLVNSLIKKIQDNLGPEIVLLERKLNEISRHKIHWENNPAGPHPIIHIFQNSLERYIHTPAALDALFRLFRSQFNREYPDLLTRLNLFFDENKILSGYGTRVRTENNTPYETSVARLQQQTIQNEEYDHQIDEQESFSYSKAVMVMLDEARLSDKHELASQFVREKMNVCINTQQTIPTLLIDVMDVGWRSLLIATVIREGTSSSNFPTYVKLINQLQLFLQYDKAYSDEQIKRANKLFAWISKLIRITTKSKVKAEKVLFECKEALVQLPNKRIALPVSDAELLLVDKESVVVDKSTIPEGVAAPKWHKLIAICENLPLGSALNLTMEQQHYDCTLEWQGVGGKNYILVTTDGQQGFNFTLPELASLILQKQVVINNLQ